MSTVRKEVLRELIADGNLKTAGDLHSYLKDLFKDTLQEMLEAELEINLGYEKRDRKNKDTDNRRNGYSSKTVKSKFGEIDIDIPRDRKGEFEPVVVPKNKRDISGIEEQIISLYARGMSTRDIHNQINGIYYFTYFLRIFKEGTNHIPIVFPTLNSKGIFFTPSFFNIHQSIVSTFFIVSCIYRFKILSKGLPILIWNEFECVSYLMNYTSLHLSIWIGSFKSLFETI